MSKLIIHEPPLQVLPSLAEKIGLNEAIVLQQVHYWLENKKNKGREHGGYKWVFNTYADWREDNFPFWSVATIQRIFTSLEKQGLIISEQIDKKKHDMTKFYRIAYDTLDMMEDSKMLSSNTPNRNDVNKNTETTTETTINLGAAIEKANKTVDAILENERKTQENKHKNYPLRDKIPEPYLEYADWYVQATGQKPRKSVLTDWLLTFDDWTSAGLDIKSLDAAYKYATRPDGFLVGRPGSLTNTAIALKSKPVASPQIDNSALEATRKLLEEKEQVKKFVPPPAGLRPKINQPQPKGA